MHPTLLAHPVHHPGWIYEEKVDGYRMVAYKDGDTVQFISRSGKTSPAGSLSWSLRSPVFLR